MTYPYVRILVIDQLYTIQPNDGEALPSPNALRCKFILKVSATSLTLSL